jgi:hypothetical protein
VLHERFGPAFRTRVSELNRDPICTIRVLNETRAGRDDRSQPCERSMYWAELRAPTEHRSELIESEHMRRTRDEQARAMPLFGGVRE